MSGERRIELLRPGLLVSWREHNPDDVICRAGDRMAEPTLNGPRLGTRQTFDKALVGLRARIEGWWWWEEEED